MWTHAAVPCSALTVRDLWAEAEKQAAFAEALNDGTAALVNSTMGSPTRSIDALRAKDAVEDLMEAEIQGLSKEEALIMLDAVQKLADRLRRR